MMLKRNQFPLSQAIMVLIFFLWILFCIGCGGGGGGDTITDNPPKISQISSSVFSDGDAIYPTGRLVRFDIEVSSGETDIISGTIRITSESTGYDSGCRNCSSDPFIMNGILPAWIRLPITL